MALKPCKECGNQISDKAKTCPQCGAAQPKKTSLFTWIVLGFIILTVIGAIFGGSKNKETQSSSDNIPKEAEATQSESHFKENWLASTSNDEMRGTKSTSTSTMSKNEVEFAFPYSGGSNLGLTVRNNAGSKDVIIVISKGQFICSSFDGCPVNFKFDNGSVQSITMVGSDSHDADILFVKNQKTANSIIHQIKNSKQLIIEPKFYQEGSKQFTFDLAGFKEP